jgi:hypothetical protein
MGASPKYKVYLDGQYEASVRHPETGAAICAMYGEGAEIRYSHSPNHVGWREGFEAFPASESYDRVGDLVRAREADHDTSKGLPV